MAKGVQRIEEVNLATNGQLIRTTTKHKPEREKWLLSILKSKAGKKKKEKDP